MTRRLAVLMLTLALPHPSSAECVAKGHSKAATAKAKAVCTAFPKAPSVDIADGSIVGSLITFSLPADDLKAIVAKDSAVRSFAKTVLKNAGVADRGNFQLTVHTIGTEDRRLFVFRGSETQVTGIYDDVIHDWESLD